MFRIRTETGFTGVAYGLPFINGTAETDNEDLAKKLYAKGYAVQREDCEGAAPPIDEENNTIKQVPGNDGDNAEGIVDEGEDSLRNNEVSDTLEADSKAAVDYIGSEKLLKKTRTEIDAYAKELGVDTTDAEDKQAAVAMVEMSLQINQ